MNRAAIFLRRLGRAGVAPVLVVAALLLALRFLLALVLIPPWQQPDEATHVALAQMQRSRIELLDGAPDPAREAEILESMARHDWWEHRGVGWPTPVPTPGRFGQAGAGDRVAVEVTHISDPPAYFLIVGRLLSWLPRLSITEDLYILRAVSALFGMLTLGVLWLAAREFAGPGPAAIVTLILALHPHFAVVSTAATPDAMTNFLGASLWWPAAAVMRTPSALRLLLVWLIAIGAAAADRMGVPLILVAVVVSGGMLATRISLAPRKVAVVLAATAVLGILAIGITAWVVETFGETYRWTAVFSALVPVEGAMTWDRFLRFNWQLHRSWWFSLGWGRYTPPGWWSVILVAITIVAVLGLARRFFRDGGLAPLTRSLIAVAVVAIGIQVFAIHWAYFRLGSGVQGRYLLPCLVPALVLFWTGIEAYVPRPQRVHAAAALVLLLAVLDAAGWWLVAIPAYYASF